MPNKRPRDVQYDLPALKIFRNGNRKDKNSRELRQYFSAVVEHRLGTTKVESQAAFEACRDWLDEVYDELSKLIPDVLDEIKLGVSRALDMDVDTLRELGPEFMAGLFHDSTRLHDPSQHADIIKWGNITLDPHYSSDGSIEFSEVKTAQGTKVAHSEIVLGIHAALKSGFLSGWDPRRSARNLATRILSHEIMHFLSNIDYLENDGTPITVSGLHSATSDPDEHVPCGTNEGLIEYVMKCTYPNGRPGHYPLANFGIALMERGEPGWVKRLFMAGYMPNDSMHATGKKAVQDLQRAIENVACNVMPRSSYPIATKNTARALTSNDRGTEEGYRKVFTFVMSLARRPDAHDVLVFANNHSGGAVGQSVYNLTKKSAVRRMLREALPSVKAASLSRAR